MPHMRAALGIEPSERKERAEMDGAIAEVLSVQERRAEIYNFLDGEVRRAIESNDEIRFT